MLAGRGTHPCVTTLHTISTFWSLSIIPENQRSPDLATSALGFRRPSTHDAFSHPLACQDHGQFPSPCG
ncbi:hypothetical protein VTO42DRAFT_559 [Malbranchea cinnamomea]